MRYKFLWGVFILLIATPVWSQEFSPIVIETGKPTPSVVKSGEPFKITYRAKFFDTVLIYEDQMRPENLALEKIEAIALVVEPKERQHDDTLGFVNVWDFTYTFRIIQPEKGIYKIPPFNFIWVEKKAGVTVEETKDKEKPKEMPTDEVGVGYVSSIIKPPPLDIRDEINFVLPIWEGTVLRQWAYGVMGGAFLLFIIIVLSFIRRIRKNKSQETGHEESVAETARSEVIVNTEPILSPKQARKKFLRELKNLRNGLEQLTTISETLGSMKKIRLCVRTLLLVELRGTIRDSMSENEIYNKLCSLELGSKKKLPSNYDVFMNLALRLKVYQEDIDSGKCSMNLFKETEDLLETVSSFRLHKRIWSFIMWYFVRSWP